MFLLLAALTIPSPVDLVGDRPWTPTRLESIAFRAPVGSRPSAAATRLTAPLLPEGKPWLGSYAASIAPARDGATVVFEAYLRSPDRHRIEVRLVGAIDKWLQLTPDWQQYRLVGRCTGKVGEQVEIWLGDSPGIVELAELRCLDFGVTAENAIPELRGAAYDGPNPDDWRAPAQERIRRLRRGPLAVTVIDAAGKPVSGCAVEIVQTRSHFRFGTECGAEFILGDDPTSARLREELLRRFNTVTFPNEFKWSTEDWSPGAFGRGLAALPWIRAHHLALRGHTLVWGSFQHSPRSLAGRPPAELRRALHRHIDEYVRKIGTDVYAWDVVNEAVWEHDFWDAVGWSEFPEVFKQVRQLAPGVLLAYNDFVQHRDLEPQGYASWKARVKQLTDAGAPFELLGDQCHLEQPFPPVARLLERWEDMARLGRRLEVTEFDACASDENLQAAYVRDFLTAAFSEPAIDGVILWGFYEGVMWKPLGALFRRDWTPKPALAAFDDLVLRDWRTKETVVTDAAGRITVPAFYGDYRLTARVAGRDCAVEADHTPEKPATVVIRLSAHD